ncbi:hypothetical protein ACQEV2_42585 [Streptomyces sp. CA-251387]|uniref:hypothetical protein n=1 Tax=Streptomyces sp. CA-251387 TaxID=3240064 RepID=UPI003D8ECA8F
MVHVTAQEAQQTLSALRRLSLIDHTSPGAARPTVRVHQLIQHAVRDTVTPDQHDQTARTAADALLDAWPDTALAQSLRANTTALANHAGRRCVGPTPMRCYTARGTVLATPDKSPPPATTSST